jgi:hypothetical protein
MSLQSQPIPVGADEFGQEEADLMRSKMRVTDGTNLNSGVTRLSAGATMVQEVVGK